jgi:hypothetical protein
MLSLLLIFIGVAMMLVAFVYIASKLVYNTGICLGKAGYGVMSYILNHLILKRQLQSDGTLQKYQEEQALKEELQKADNERRYDEQLKRKHDEIVYAVLSKLRDLRMRYPLADESLFNQYRDNFNSVPLEVLGKIEEEIKRQHLERAYVKPLGSYKKEDLDNLDIIEQEKKLFDYTSIIVTLYQDKNTYIVRAQNPENYIDEMYVTQNLILAKHVQNKIIAKCQTNWLNRRVQKSAVLNLDDFNDAVGESVRNIDRYNNM